MTEQPPATNEAPPPEVAKAGPKMKTVMIVFLLPLLLAIVGYVCAQSLVLAYPPPAIPEVGASPQDDKGYPQTGPAMQRWEEQRAARKAAEDARRAVVMLPFQTGFVILVLGSIVSCFVLGILDLRAGMALPLSFLQGCFTTVGVIFGITDSQGVCAGPVMFPLIYLVLIEFGKMVRGAVLGR